MLEDGDALRTWALTGAPGSAPDEGEAVVAERLADHRLAYLDYEGPLSDDRGSVTRWDCGTFTWQQDTAEAVEVRLDGARLCGTLAIRVQQGIVTQDAVPEDRATQRWRVEFTPG
jgi:hypothetical protein